MNSMKLFTIKSISISLNQKSLKLLSHNLCVNKLLMNINTRKMTTDKKNISKATGKQSMRPIKELKQIELIDYENKFHSTRKLSVINPMDYKKWLTKECIDSNYGSDVYVDKFDKLQTICQIYNKTMENTFRVPSKLTNDSMKQLLELDFAQIHKQLAYLFNTEFQRWYGKQLKIKESIKTRERLESTYNEMNASRIGIFNNNNELVYGLWHNTLFTRLKQSKTEELIARTKLKTAAYFGQNIVIDFDYEEYMNRLTIKELLAHICKFYYFNKSKLKDAFNITFCNLNNSGYIMELMPSYFKKGQLIDYYVNTSSDSYLNLFPREKLVYICPQASELLVEYDHDAVYILCGVVQKRLDPPLSMSKVRQEGLKMKRIPIEHYVQLRDGFSLEISNSLQILANLRDNIDMSEAVQRIIPEYSKKTESEIEKEDEERIRKLFYTKRINKKDKRRYL